MTEQDSFSELLDEVKALRKDLRAARRGVLTREEAADYLRISVRNLHDLRSDGRIKAVQLSPARHGCRREELERFLEENEAGISAAEVAEVLVREAGVR